MKLSIASRELRKVHLVEARKAQPQRGNEGKPIHPNESVQDVLLAKNEFQQVAKISTFYKDLACHIAFAQRDVRIHEQPPSNGSRGKPNDQGGVFVGWTAVMSGAEMIDECDRVIG